MTLEQLGLGSDPPNGSSREKGATEILQKYNCNTQNYTLIVYYSLGYNVSGKKG